MSLPCPPHVARVLHLALVAILMMSGGALAQELRPAPSEGDLEFFERDVRPVLTKRCHSCHGPDRQRAELRLDHAAGVAQGGAGGAVVVPGKPEESRLVGAIRYQDPELRMPPRGKLPDAERRVLEEWVARGAPWPEDHAVPEASGEEAFDLELRRATHWAWQPLRAVVTPPVRRADWPTDPVDHFVLARLEEAGLAPAPDAERATLARRAFFDLTGLPPTPEELAAFLADGAPDAFERLVDRLLASPHFGEHWARHWLDLVRYAETYGHEFDYPIANAWQYRDYVVRAFDADVPYDQFVREHLAGDLLPQPRRHPTAGYDESIIGTGFWFFGQATHGPVDVRGDEAERVDNQIDVFTKTFLGLTVSCARCHDHKFDAISAQDYYALAGFLQSSRRQDAWLDPGGEIAAATAELRELRPRGDRSLARDLAAALAEPIARTVAVARALAPTLPASDVAFEAEALGLASPPVGQFRGQPLDDRWTGGRHMWWTGAGPGDELQLSLPVNREGRYELTIAGTRARDYARIAVLLDGVPVGEEIDLYAPDVVPTGGIPLGSYALTAGDHTLTVRIVGANPKAVPAHMVGLDTIALRAVDAAGRGARERLIDEAAAREGLAPARLAAWLDGMDAPESGLAAVWHALAAAGGASGTDGRAESTTFATFDDGVDGWYVTGDAFASSSTGPGAWRLDNGRPVPVPAGCLHSGLWSDRHRGALRSPTFTIEKRHIHYRIAGRGARVRLIVDGYVMDQFNGLLFGGFTQGVDTDGRFVWLDQGSDVGRYIGHRAHIEILDEGDGWVAIDEVRFADGPPVAAGGVAIYIRWSDGTDRGPAACLEDAVRAAARAALAGRASVAETALLGRLLAAGVLGAEPTDESRDFAAAWTARAESVPEPMAVIAMTDGGGEDEYVFIRGSHKQRGETVPRRFLTALAGPDQPPIASGSGRLELANRLLDESDPLPARVLVNRVWHHLFGRGLVPTCDNFGALGEAPSHPELLDHLALWFRNEARWSLKKLVRRLVTTRTWRMSSHPTSPAAEEADPDVRLLHRMRVRRLSAEVIRDAVLAASGRLDRTRYGPPVTLHLTPFLEGRGRPGRDGPRDGAGRRSLYQEVRRNFLSPLMTAFDFPIPFSTAGRRTVSNVPAQALALMNDPFIVDQARVLAERILAAAPSRRERVRALYLASFSREPERDEERRALAFVDLQARAYGAAAAERGDQLDAWADLTHVLFNAKEFLFVN